MNENRKNILKLEKEFSSFIRNRSGKRKTKANGLIFNFGNENEYNNEDKRINEIFFRINTVLLFEISFSPYFQVSFFLCWQFSGF